MKNTTVYVACCVALVAGLCFLPLRSADAYLNFSKAFLKKYGSDKSSEAHKSVAHEFTRVKKCAVCHDPRPGADGKVSKKNRNPYSQALNEYLTKKDQNDPEKILKALADIEDKKPEKAEKTYGQLLSEGKLPFVYEDYDYAGGKEDDKDD